ncbi:MAG: hexokinase [Kiritimatiellae bacterium]|nr:hexokinase [Kiritimatiellia bacterium]
MSTTPISSFLIRHGFDLASLNPDALLDTFSREATAGLRGEPSSLAMIPSYLGVGAGIPAGKPVIVVDAGGTNLRVCTVSFGADGTPAISNFSKCAMPGVEREVGADEFFAFLASRVEPLVPLATDIGFCFSYPAEITPDCDGRLLRWSKQIKAPEVVGKFVGAELRRRLEPMGFKGRIAVLNDTVATLLAGVSAGASRNCSYFVGMILGTGTNTATVVANGAIAKCPTLPAGGATIVNLETGDFAPVPLSDFDRRLHSLTLDPGHYNFEKQISGGYLGLLGLAVLKTAAEDGLFGAAAARGILALPALENRDFDDFCDNPFRAGGALAALEMEDADRRVAQALGEAVYSRAATLSAVNIAFGAILSGGGHDPLAPVCINIDGSTYYKTKTAEFKSRTEAGVRAMLGARGVHYRTIYIPDSPIVGAAVAGLTA